MITIFTPTYNRAYILPQLYNSLLRQSNTKFIWMVIDDGSTDDTGVLIEKWKSERKIAIEYVRKENGGMHTAHNKAFDLVTTDCCVCIDSDDYLPDTGVADMLEAWDEIKDEATLAGVIGLDANKEGEVIGSRFPDGLTRSTLNALQRKHKVTGDKKLVMRTLVVQEFDRYPEYSEERLVPLGTLYLKIDQKYQWSIVNKVFCIVEYLQDGSTRNILNQYRRNPKGFAYERQLRIALEPSIGRKFRNYIHLVSSAFFAGDLRLLTSAKYKYLMPLAFVPGLLFHWYVLGKTKRS